MAQHFIAKKFDVQPGHMLCRQCRTAYENINASSSDTEVVVSAMDDIDEDALDDAIYKVYETPAKHIIQVWKWLACLQ